MGSSEQPQENKRIVARFFEIALGEGEDLDLLDELVAVDYVQHNPAAGQGLEDVKSFMRDVLRPRKRQEPDEYKPHTVNYIAEEDLVVRQEIRPVGMLIDIFRVEDGMLREHWDAYRPAPGADGYPWF